MLTDTAIRKLKAAAKPYKRFDAHGLYIEVQPTGAKYWRLKYRVGGKERRLAFGVYPEVTLAEARARRDEARRKVREGLDPAVLRKVEKARDAHTFGAVAAEWLRRQHGHLADVTFRKAEWLLGFAAALDDRPIHEITAPDVLTVLRKIEGRGTIETAHRVKQRIGQVMRYAIATGRADTDVTAFLRGALTPVTTTHRAALTRPDDIATLLRAIDGYRGQPATCAALKLAPLLFVRPGNLRAMEWAELDLDDGLWRIPAGKMKMHAEHVVPLATQAVAILRELHRLTGRGRYCFPSLRSRDRPMSENTVNVALRTMGYDKARMTGHGFRSLASTRLNEMGWSPDVIELQLAHKERDQVRAAYNRAERLADRGRMMQAWADYLDGLRTGANVVPIRAKANAE